MSIFSGSCQFAVVGSGPYGLAVASHLRRRGLEVLIFGKVPERTLTLNHYAAAHNFARPELLPLEEFVRYGRWFQHQALPDHDERDIENIEAVDDGFHLTLTSGDCVEAQRVVVATGIGPFANYPAPFAELPRALVSHASDRSNRDLTRFAGQRVAVVGGGQSALESAALLHEAGVEVELLIRQPNVRWLSPSGFLEWMMDLKINPFRAPGKIGPIFEMRTCTVFLLNMFEAFAREPF